MAVDDELAKSLNLLRASPSFVLRRTPGASSLDVINPTSIPNDGSDYWVAATSFLKCGRQLPTVAVIWAGGETGKFYWFSGGRWIESDDPVTLNTLGLKHDEVFPFDWRYAVPLDADPYHGGVA